MAAAPAWLDAAFCERALRAGGEEDARVAAAEARPANAPGDHYASQMFRVAARLAGGGQRSLIVKCLPAGAQFRQHVARSGVFRVEGSVFASTVLRMWALLDAAAPARYPPFAARCLLWEGGDGEGDGRQVIVFDDLSEQGFLLADRRRGLGLRHSLLALRHSLLALRSLARFHAASRALLETGEGLRELAALPNPFRSIRAAFERIVLNNFRLLAAELERWPGFERYAAKVRALMGGAFDKFAALNAFDPGAFHVLLHGDCWVNNMLFRYDGGRPADVRFCDLQIAHPGPPAIDLIYFLFSSVSEDVSAHHSELLLRAYHAELSATLRLLGCARRLRWEELRAQLQACGAYATLTAFGVLAVVKADGVFDTERALEGDGGGGANARLFRSPAYARWVRRLLPQFERDGWLDL